jgi:hypothetical protein
MADEQSADDSQQAEETQTVAREVASILTPNEEVLYIAHQNVTSLSVRRDSVIATSNRLILYRPHLVGRVDFTDLLWEDVKNVRVKEGVLASEISVETRDGRVETLGNLDKAQARRLYSIGQQKELEWREKHRIRRMEEERARAGGVQVSMPQSAEPQDDQVARLAKAKAMLDQGLISEAEYETLKAKILGSL